MWNELESAGVVSRRRQPYRERVQNVPDSYDIIDTVSPRGGPPPKNCTSGAGCCVPKCFAEKGNRGLPGLNGLPGPKGK
jgi:collagen type IV alpha